MRPLPSARKRVGFYDWEGTNTVRFQRAAAGMQSPHMKAGITILSIYYLSNILDRNIITFWDADRGKAQDIIRRCFQFLCQLYQIIAADGFEAAVFNAGIMIT